MPEWRNWETHKTQNLAEACFCAGSSPASGTMYPNEESGTWEMSRDGGMADTLVSGTSALYGRGGSTPPLGTKIVF